MNQIYITERIESVPKQAGSKVYVLTLSEANKMLPILRQDHFNTICISIQNHHNPNNLKFLVQLSRLLKKDGKIVLEKQNQTVAKLIKMLGLFEHQNEQKGHKFSKVKPSALKEVKYEPKLSIGFKKIQEEEQIDEQNLLKDQNIDLSKTKAEKCDDKPKACANCSCGRKDAKKTTSKQQVIKSINEGKPVSGCGKCFLGDSFRCGSCPYKGLPAFKPGDKLKMMEQGSVMIEDGGVIISQGKVKLQL